jgi:thioredoxin 1
MASKNILAIDDATFDREVLGSPLPFLLEFGAAWCPPCRALEPIVARIADENAGRVRVGTIDVDDSREVARRFGIRGAPTVIVFIKGKEVARHLGATNRGRLLAMLDAIDSA